MKNAEITQYIWHQQKSSTENLVDISEPQVPTK